MEKHRDILSFEFDHIMLMDVLNLEFDGCCLEFDESSVHLSHILLQLDKFRVLEELIDLILALIVVELKGAGLIFGVFEMNLGNIGFIEFSV